MTQNNDRNVSQILATIEKELGYSSEKLPGRFRRAATEAGQTLPPQQLITWAQEGLALANCTEPLSVEVAGEYFQTSPKVLATVPFANFLDWIKGGKTLCRTYPGLTVAYIKSSPETLPILPKESIEVWAEIGRSLFKNNPESIALTRSFFAITPDLLQSLSLSRIERLTLFLNRLAKTSYDLANECLNTAPGVFVRLEPDEQIPFINLALTLVRTHPQGATRLFVKGAEVVTKIEKVQQKTFLSLVTKIAGNSARRALSFFFNSSRIFSEIDISLHSRLLRWSEDILSISPAASIEFLNNFPVILTRVNEPGLERWVAEGIRILRQNQDAGVAHFTLESLDEESLGQLYARVDLEDINRLLLIYCQAMAGTKIQIRSIEGPGERTVGWIHRDRPTTDGSTIFVPSSIGKYHSERENFDWYKVAVTHQVGHIEFGSYNFSFEKEASLFTNRRQRLSARTGAGRLDIVRFFSIFDDIQLSLDIFTIVEDARIDHILKQEYAGIRNVYRWIEQESRSRRPLPSSLPMREAFLELLIRTSLDDEPQVVPATFRDQFQSALPILRQVQSRQASVEDSAEATIRLYEIISTIPNQRLAESQWDTPDTNEPKIVTDGKIPDQENQEDVVIESDLETPYTAPAEVEFRGIFNPEFIQLLQQIQEAPDYIDSDPLTLTPEEIEISNVLRGEVFTSGLYVTDLPVTANTNETAAAKPDEDQVESKNAKFAGSIPGSEEGESFYYDEWDHWASAYRPQWCRVQEKTLAEGETDFFDETLARNSLLANQIKKQFEMLSPELHQKQNRLYDGEGLDLNAVIEAIVDRKAGQIPDEKVYWKRRKIVRDVAVIFLIDMSSSTADIINNTEEEDDDFADLYFARFEALMRSRADRARGSSKGPRQVIDIAKESMVLMINALEATGDCYGIYGFSGHGRENVEFLVVKDINEGFSPAVKKRIDRVRPRHSTRMGPAIRHASSKLAAHDAKTKILFLVSDGYPQDEEYGRDNNDKEYALHDTRMALIEAKRMNITPFCLTIDIAGYDYLKKMAPDIGYEVVNDVESLPERLPILYRRLTA